MHGCYALADTPTLLRALTSATESGDPNLVYLALFHLYRHMSLQDLLDLLATRPYARNLFLSYCQRQEPALLEQLCSAMGMVEGVARMKVGCWGSRIFREKGVGRKGVGRKVLAGRVLGRVL